MNQNSYGSMDLWMSKTIHLFTVHTVHTLKHHSNSYTKANSFYTDEDIQSIVNTLKLSIVTWTKQEVNGKNTSLIVEQ